MFDGALTVFHVEVDLRVRIPVIPFGGDTFQGDRLVQLIRNVAAMMGQHGKAEQQKENQCEGSVCHSGGTIPIALRAGKSIISIEGIGQENDWQEIL